MNVKNTILMMMKAYPSLYRSRLSALKQLFDTGTYWENGQLILEDAANQYQNRTAEMWDETEELREYQAADPGTVMEQLAARHLLLRRRENAEAQFVLANAELLAVCPDYKSKLRSVAHFSGKRFDDMPDNAQADWREAAIELAMAVADFKFLPHEQDTPTDPYEEQTAESIKRANKFSLKYING